MIFTSVILLACITSAFSACSNPSGDSCSWYTNCLEANKPCGSEGYAIKYASHFCNKYDQNYASFSANGKRWVSAVKKCLQQKLAPLLNRPGVSCSDLKRIAFESHVPCYVDPTGTGSPSWCSLSFMDHTRVINTIKGAVLTELKETIKGGWNTLARCMGKKK